MTAHCGVVVVPARVRKPKDKAKVEAGVLLVERWILARLSTSAIRFRSSISPSSRKSSGCADLCLLRCHGPFDAFPGWGWTGLP
ncbi:MAG: hypothetical protein FIA97_16680 [Methylococcaceae bacterium]|nr:hypothetical protein [Methylococcaceae bacterium]